MLFLFSGGSPGQSICRFSGFGSVLGSSSSSGNAQGTGPNILYSNPNILYSFHLVFQHPNMTRICYSSFQFLFHYRMLLGHGNLKPFQHISDTREGLDQLLLRRTITPSVTQIPRCSVASSAACRSSSPGNCGGTGVANPNRRREMDSTLGICRGYIGVVDIGVIKGLYEQLTKVLM